MLGLTERLGLDPELALPAYEDPAYFLAKEHALPPNLDTADNKLDDPMERARLAKVFERGLDVASGYVLPIQRWQAQGAAALAQPALGDPARQAVPGARRFAGGLSPAAWAPCPGWSPTSATPSCRSIPSRPTRPCRRTRRCCSRGVQAGAAGDAGSGTPAAGRGADRAGDRAARRPALHLHAADRECRGVRRAGGRDRGHGGRARPAGAGRGLPAARRPAAERDQGDARPGRDRGQHPALPQLGGAGRDHRGALRGGAAVAARHLQVPDRRPAGRHRRRQPCRDRRQVTRRTARSCAGPTCWPRWSPTGRTTRASATCSRACSSARPARRRGSTRRARTSSTSSRSRSARSPTPAAAPARPGWSTGSSATC